MTDSALNPPWLAAWRAQGEQPPTRREPQPRQGGNGELRTVSAVAAAKRPITRTAITYGFKEPEPWAYDGGQRREAVLDTDHHPPRVVRKVGWRSCLRCGKPFWSEDVVRLRLCAGTFGGCRDHHTKD